MHLHSQSRAATLKLEQQWSFWSGQNAHTSSNDGPKLSTASEKTQNKRSYKGKPKYDGISNWKKLKLRWHGKMPHCESHHYWFQNTTRKMGLPGLQAGLREFQKLKDCTCSRGSCSRTFDSWPPPVAKWSYITGVPRPPSAAKLASALRRYIRATSSTSTIPKVSLC